MATTLSFFRPRGGAEQDAAPLAGRGLVVEVVGGRLAAQGGDRAAVELAKDGAPEPLHATAFRDAPAAQRGPEPAEPAR